MASFKPTKIDLTKINQGLRYKDRDGLHAESINNAIEASAYAQALATNQPTVENANVEGTPSVSIEEVNGLPRFKFEHIKGIQGERGFTGSKLVKMELQGQDENGGNIYLMTFDDGTTATFTAPKGARGLNGKDGEGAVVTNGTWATRRPFITFTADDGYEEDITILEPIFKKYNIPCCCAMITNRLNNIEKRLDLQNNHGWEVMCHSTSGTPLTQMTLNEVETAMVESKTTLEELGFVIKDFAYPSGDCNTQIKQIAKKYFRAGYCFTPHHTTSVNVGILDSFSLWRVPLGSFTNGADYSTLEYYKSCVDRAVVENGWLIFCLHSAAADFDATQQQYLDELLAYIQNKGVETGNLSQGYAIFGNYIECGASANKRIAKTDEERKRFVVTNTGEHNIPIQELMPLKRTNSEVLTDYPLNKLSIAEISNNNSEFPLNVGGTLITSRFEHFGFQMWFPHRVGANDVYKRTWQSTAWGAWTKVSASSSAATDTQISRKFVMSQNWSDNFPITIKTRLYIRTFDIIGNTTATLTKKYYNLTEISTDKDNPTVIGTTSDGLDIQMYYQTGYLLFKYSGTPSSYNAYIEIAYDA